MVQYILDRAFCNDFCIYKRTPPSIIIAAACSARVYLSICWSVALSLCLSVWLLASIFGDQSARPVIARSAYSRYVYREGGGGIFIYRKPDTLC